MSGASQIARLAVRFLLVSLLLAAPASAVNVKFIVDGPWDRGDEIVNVFQKEFRDLLGDEFAITFDEESVVHGDYTAAGVTAIVKRALADPGVDVVIGLGPLSSHVLGQQRDLPKPVIAPIVIDPEIQGIPRSGNSSGVRNLSYVTSFSSVQRDFEVFHELVPFEKLAFFITNTTREAIPGIEDRTRRAAETVGADVVLVLVGETAREALDSIPADADAAYVTPLLRLPVSEFDALVAGLIEKRLPSFSLLGRSEVERGLMASVAPESEFPRIARRCALNLQRILLGEKASELPVVFRGGDRLSFNVATARAIGVRPSWQTLTEAEIIGRQRREVSRTISLADAVRDAIAVNLDLAASERTVAAGREDVKFARSSLLPQIDVSASGVVIDEERAAASFGQTAERTISGSATLSQVLYSDDAWTNLDINQKFQVSLEKEREQLELDIAQQAATAYLNVLRAKTFERIQQDNLRRTQTNLELARVRQKVGYSSPGEVYRWRGEIATQRGDVIEANSQRNLAEISLNRLLHRPLEERFATEDTDLGDPRLVVSDPRVRAFLDDPWSFRVLREFMTTLAVEHSPEIRALDETIAAQERLVANAKRSFFIPTVGLQGEISHVFDRQGEGSDPAAGPLPTNAEDTSWNLGILASLPLFSGGGRLAEKNSAQETLRELEIRREAAVERIEERVLSAAHVAGSSFANIALSQEAAQAANQNLELVLDSYSQGVVTIIDLLDAQNNALVAEERAANAAYDFLVDLMELQRAAGKAPYSSSAEQREEFIRRLESFRDERDEP